MTCRTTRLTRCARPRGTQLEQSVEDSWAECELHARNLLGELEYQRLKRDLATPGSVEGTTDRPAEAPHPGGGSRAADPGNGQGLLFEELGPRGRQGGLW